jgi:enterochelin esterase-like enzyme
MIRHAKVIVALSALFSTAGVSADTALAQAETEIPPVVAGAKPVTVEKIRIHGAHLEGNLEGNSADREVLVFLPPSYGQDVQRRYPVVYALHGYSIGAEQWSHEIHVPQTIEGAFAQGAREMIVVLPDSKTMHNGSMYSSSVTTGDFERFIARDVVSYIDEHYRTIPERQARGLVGHSMGGYGASRIGMKHADVFGSLYIMSPCCLSPRGAGRANPEAEATLAAVTSPAESAQLPFGLRAQLAAASAWSPNPQNPPLYLDLPTRSGEVQPDVLSRFAANAPLAFIHQYVGELRRYDAISLDVGDQDGLRGDTGKLHEVLNSYGIENSLEVYPGTHVSRIAFRFQDHVLPFFSRHLCAEPGCE